MTIKKLEAKPTGTHNHLSKQFNIPMTSWQQKCFVVKHRGYIL